tara:strand:- start:13205 stop:13504 length:300 start_codon:yes stop_codon:yes gene_type:complete
MAAIASQLVQGNQPLFDKCANSLAKLKYDGDVLSCFRAERKKLGLDKDDIDSNINVTEKSMVSWSNADGSVTNGFAHSSKEKVILGIGIFLGICYLINK